MTIASSGTARLAHSGSPFKFCTGDGGLQRRLNIVYRRPVLPVGPGAVREYRQPMTPQALNRVKLRP